MELRSTLPLLALLPALALSQISPQAHLDRETARRVADRVASAIEENYVFPDTGHMVAEYLRGRIRAGAYDAPMSTGQLADHLGADIKTINGDLHLYVNFIGAQAGAAQAGPRMVMRRPGDQLPPEQLLQSRRNNYDIRSAQRLAGNVGYVSVGLLSARTDEALRVFDAAMAFLEYTDAMIIDLRKTAGGDPRMADYVASYFFGPDSVRTLNSYMRAFDQTRERWTGAVNGKTRPTVPVYVLVGPGTASGAEDLAFIFKQTKRGRLVGEKTAGAGRLTRTYPVGDGFVVSVPGGRTYDPRTGLEWERVGIRPDISASGDALVTAHSEALTRLASAATDTTWRRSLTWAREAVQARARPFIVDHATLESYAGTYDLRVISFENGKLWHQRDANRPKEELVPIDDHTFAIGEVSRIEFLRDGGRVTGFRLLATPEMVSTYPRTR
jgi:retinol-binding protein 3